MKSHHATVEINVTGTEAFCAFVARVLEFVDEYAWHNRDCAAVDADGEWHRGNAACTCGYDEDLANLTETAGGGA